MLHSPSFSLSPFSSKAPSSLQSPCHVTDRLRSQPPHGKIAWFGQLLGIKPRIRMVRSYDESSPSYLGYVLSLDGTIDHIERKFPVAIGVAAQTKHQFRAGDVVSGLGIPVADPQLETAELYKSSGFKVDARETALPPPACPPWRTIPLALEAYRTRGHRRRDAARYVETCTTCTTCTWGCMMVVEIVKDNWKGIVTGVREETFCYGLKSCAFYKAGPKRRAPGRGDAMYVEEDLIDEDATAHRAPEE